MSVTKNDCASGSIQTTLGVPSVSVWISCVVTISPVLVSLTGCCITLAFLVDVIVFWWCAIVPVAINIASALVVDFASSIDAPFVNFIVLLPVANDGLLFGIVYVNIHLPWLSVKTCVPFEVAPPTPYVELEGVQCALTWIPSKYTFNALLGFMFSAVHVISILLINGIASILTSLSFSVLTISSTTCVCIPLLADVVGVVVTSVNDVLVPAVPSEFTLPPPSQLSISGSISSHLGSNSATRPFMAPRIAHIRPPPPRPPPILVTVCIGNVSSTRFSWLTTGIPCDVSCHSFQTVPTPAIVCIASKFPSTLLCTSGICVLSCHWSASGLNVKLPMKFAMLNGLTFNSVDALVACKYASESYFNVTMLSLITTLFDLSVLADNPTLAV